MKRDDFRRELGQQLRVDAIRASDAAGSGHPTSSMSAADLLAVLLDGHFHYDFAHPENPNNDHLIFSKGHASPLVYAYLKAAGAIEDDELLSFRKFGSRLQGHPTPVIPWIDVATGSLGQGLPIGVGVALAAKRLDRLPYRVWVLCGDSEMAEGSIWEAFEHAAFAGLDNLVAILDVNRLGQRGETMHGWDLESYVGRAEAFGWEAIAIDGHDVGAIEDAYSRAVQVSGRPTVIVARTLKGQGVKAVEDQDGQHGKPLPDGEQAIAELGGVRDLRVEVDHPEGDGKPHSFAATDAQRPAYEVGTSEATRKAYGAALAWVGARHGDVVALDGEVSNSTGADTFAEAHPERFFEMYIAEQQMVAAAVGMQVRGWVPFASTFAAFLSRAYDFVRMAAISQADIRLVGSHAGVSIGEDGPSQMALEDLASLRAVAGSTVLYPCDANQTVALVEAMAVAPGISYMRTTRGSTPVLYGPEDSFEIGGSRILRTSASDELAIIAAGITVPEALAAADRLAEEGIAVRVIDLYSVKPVDVETVRAAAAETGGIVTVEDHWPEGGVGDAVLDALSATREQCGVRKLAVTHLPGSGTSQELMHEVQIDADAIVAAARELAAARVR
ncbi:MAG: transketolase [Solirubrobacteraceae bacterium]|nr:MAG: transketolase [Solirubrobacterales bacterium]